MSNLQIPNSHPLSGSNIPTASLLAIVHTREEITETGETEYIELGDLIEIVDYYFDCPDPERETVIVFFDGSGSIDVIEPYVKNAVQQLQTSYGSTLEFGYTNFDTKRTFSPFNNAPYCLVIQGESSGVYTDSGSGATTALADSDYFFADNSGNHILVINDPSIPSGSAFQTMLGAIDVDNKFTTTIGLNTGSIQYYYDTIKTILTSEGAIV
jgi:hypothetical protein